MRVRNWDSLAHAKFCKDLLRGYTPFGQIYNCTNRKAVHAYCQLAMYSPGGALSTAVIRLTFTDCFQIVWHIQDGNV